jgi:hypothetical protein
MTDMHDLSRRFLDAVRPARVTRTGKPWPAPKNVIDDADFAEFLLRMIRNWEQRVIANPEMLAQHRVIQARTSEISDVAIAINAARFAVDQRSGVSMLGCARILGVGKSDASRARARGVAIMGDRIDRAGAARFAELQRERDAVKAAQETPAYVDELAAWRARRAG